MGTLFTITTYSTDLVATQALLDEAFDMAQEFSDRATDYDPRSELNQLVLPPINEARPVSPQLFEVLLLAQEIATETQGLFDPTFGPLTHLWRESRRTQALPTSEEIAAAQARCGIDKITLDRENQTFTAHQVGLQLDLGGIAKGFAADLLFDFLREKGHPRTLIAAAGDLRLGDPPPDKEGWSVGLRTFRLTPTKTLALKNCAVSTSGDLFQNFEADGKTYSHLIDPRTGLGLTTRRAATVIMPLARYTDPLATAACLADDPVALLARFPGSSLRLLTDDPETPPVLTGFFAP